MSPENPFTLDNPDIIVANGNKLYAIYIPTYSEIENTDHLLRRLYLSQLSYGYKLIPVLLVFEEGAVKMLDNRKFCSAFAHISNSIEDAISFVNHGNFLYQRTGDFSEIQFSQYELYRKYLRLSEVVHHDIQSQFSAPEEIRFQSVVTRSWSSDKQKTSNSFWSVPGGFVASIEKKKYKSFRTAFEQVMTLAFMSKFNFDDGELFPTGMYNELSVMNTDWAMFDEDSLPNSYNHMLSFIGLPPMSIL